MEVDSDIVADGKVMKSEEKERQEEKEVGSVKLSIWRTSKSYGYNYFPLTCCSNRFSFFN